MSKKVQRIIGIVLAVIGVLSVAMLVFMIVVKIKGISNVESKVSKQAILDARGSEESEESEDWGDETPSNALRISVDGNIEATASGVGDAEKGKGTETEIENDGEYVFPNSDTQLLTDADVSGLSAEKLRIARNEIIARHGRIFSDASLKSYFESKSWYSGTIPADQFDSSIDNVLNSTEKANIELIKKYENQ